MSEKTFSKDLLIKLVQSLKKDELTIVLPEYKPHQAHINGFNTALDKIKEEIENLK